MNSNKSNMCADGNGHETLSRFLSSIGCSCNTNETNCGDENSVTSLMATERIPISKFSYPSFSLTDNDDEEQNEEKEYDSDSSSRKREAVHSKASQLMSQKRVFHRSRIEEKEKKVCRIMLENILESFDRLVDARIRAYARILSNHIQVLSESNNTKGARIAEYKLRTLLEVATNHLQFDSISTNFKKCASGDDDAPLSTTVPTADEKGTLSIPIQLTAEIRSPRLFFEGLETMNCSDGACPTQPGHQGKLKFRAKGRLRGVREADRCFSKVGDNVEGSNDTDSCLTPEKEDSRNSIDTQDNSFWENIEIEIDCDALLSQMMEEASKVVAMAVELTNLAWANNIEKQEEINKMNVVPEDTKKTANVIADDDDLSTSEMDPPARLLGKRSRIEDNAETHGNTTMSKQVSEISIHPPSHAVRNEKSRVSSIPTTTTTITNLHVLQEDEDRKARYSHVSDPSYASSTAGTEHDFESHAKHEEDGSYNVLAAERACHIVDFVLAGDIIPHQFTPSKKLRTK